MKKIKSFENFIKKDLTKDEIDIINDILSTNEDFSDWFNKFIQYGKRGLLTATIILSIAFSGQAQNSNKTQDVIKQGIELSTDEVKKDVYCFMVGISTESSSMSIKKGDIDAAGAFKEISKHYQNLRDGKTTDGLSSNAKKYLGVLTSTQEKLDQNAMRHFIELGKTIKNIN